jgi:hypothetical protein
MSKVCAARGSHALQEPERRAIIVGRLAGGEAASRHINDPLRRQRGAMTIFGSVPGLIQVYTTSLTADSLHITTPLAHLES